MVFVDANSLSLSSDFISVRPGKLDLLFRISNLLNLHVGGWSLFITSKCYGRTSGHIYLEGDEVARSQAGDNKSSLPCLNSELIMSDPLDRPFF